MEKPARFLRRAFLAAAHALQARLPAASQLGAAQGLLAGMLLVIAVRWVLSARVIPGLNLLRAAVPAAAAAGCMALAFYAAADLYWMTQCLIGMAVYGMCLAAMLLLAPGMPRRSSDLLQCSTSGP